MSKKILIDRIQITLEPFRYAGAADIQVTIKVDALGTAARTNFVLKPDDLETHFDLWFDRAKESLRAELKRQADLQEPAVKP